MSRLPTFLRTHGEALFFGTVFAIGLCIATGVIGPTLDRHDAERAAVAHR